MVSDDVNKIGLESGIRINRYNKSAKVLVFPKRFFLSDYISLQQSRHIVVIYMGHPINMENFLIM